MTPDAILSFLETAEYSYRLIAMPGACELTTWPYQGRQSISFRGSTIIEACEMAKRELLPTLEKAVVTHETPQ